MATPRAQRRVQSVAAPLLRATNPFSGLSLDALLTVAENLDSVKDVQHLIIASGSAAVQWQNFWYLMIIP